MDAMHTGNEEATYHWIDPAAIPDLSGKKIILFGAGKGGEEFLHYAKARRLACAVLAVADNDQSFWGRSWQGLEVVPPTALPSFVFDQVVITSISGPEAISGQLRDLGCTEQQLLAVGRYPLTYQNNFRFLISHLEDLSWLNGRRCLTIGPGGFLGLEVLLYCLGAAKVCAIDKFAFGVEYPAIRRRWPEYEGVRSFLYNLDIDPDLKERAGQRFSGLFHSREQEDRHMDATKVEYLHPEDVEALSAGSSTCDVVFSHAVLEHVRNPARAVEEMYRVLRPGGRAIHKIITEDHRCFSSVEGYTPFSFRQYSEEEWNTVTRDKFYQNRLLPVDWLQLHLEKGFRLEKFEVENHLSLSPREMAGFHETFRHYSPEEASQVNPVIVAEKAE